MIITKFVEYPVKVPEFFIDYIQKDLDMRDLPGITNGTIHAIRVSEHHALSVLLGQAASGVDSADFSHLPSVSVIGESSNESSQTIGDSERTDRILTMDWVNEVLSVPPQERVLGGIISDKQVRLIEEAIKNSPNGRIISKYNAYRLDNKVGISVYSTETEKVNILVPLMQSILFSMRDDMAKMANYILPRINADTDLQNDMFGKMIYGVEILLDYQSELGNYVVTDVPPIMDSIPQNPVSIWKMINGAWRWVTYNKYVDIDAEYRGV